MWERSQAELNEIYEVAAIATPFISAYGIEHEVASQLFDIAHNLSVLAGCGQVWAQDSLAHEDALANLLALHTDPSYLVHWAFTMWKDQIDHNNDAALGIIGEEFLSLMEVYEQKYRAANNGQPSEFFQRSQQSNIKPVMGSQGSNQRPQVFVPQSAQQIPVPPIQGSNGAGNGLDALYQQIQTLKNPPRDYVYQLQRQHAATRQRVRV